jgi:hypothetical protein
MEHEHAAIPVILAGGDESRGALQIRFFDELGNSMHRTNRSTAADVAVAGMRGAGYDSKGRKPPLAHHFKRRQHCGLKRGNIRDDMVCGKHEEHRVGVRLGRGHCNFERCVRSERNRRRRVAAEGLKENGARLDIKLPQLFGNQKAMRVVTYDKGRRRLQTRQAQRRLLEHGVLAGQRQKLLRIQLPRQGPQARTGSPG